MQNVIGFFVVALFVVLAVFVVLAIGGIGMMGGGLLGGGMMGGMMGFPLMGGLVMFALPVLFIALSIVLGIALMRGESISRAPAAPLTRQDVPLDVLKMRYARGEITQEQFTEMRRQLDV